MYTKCIIYSVNSVNEVVRCKFYNFQYFLFYLHMSADPKKFSVYVADLTEYYTVRYCVYLMFVVQCT